MKGSGFRLSIGSKVRQARLRHGWSQEELAEKAEVHPSFIGQIERGIRSVSFITLERLSCALGVEPAEFFKGASGAAIPDKPYPIERKILNLLKGCSSREQQVVYQTIKHILRQRRKLTG